MKFNGTINMGHVPGPRVPKFKTGDRVKIIKYGSLICGHKKEPHPPFPIVGESEYFYWLDMDPELVGLCGTVMEASMTQGIPKYSLTGLRKVAWYDEQQLEAI